MLPIQHITKIDKVKFPAAVSLYAYAATGWGYIVIL